MTSPPPRAAAERTRCDVLLVDDDPDIRDTLEEILEAEGYRVATAGTGTDALARARLDRPRLILLDLFMPVMDGAEFRRLQLSDPAIAAIPVVVVSGAADAEERVGALAVAGHLEKPLQVEQLVAVVARHCA